MSDVSAIHVFSKPGCSYCDRAKSLLERLGMPYLEHDVSKSARAATASFYFSGSQTVPQVFIGDYHINGAEDLEELDKSGRLSAIVEAAKSRELPFGQIGDDELAKGGEDIALRDHLEEIDGSRSDDSEYRLVLQFYQEFFGFWPNCFLYSYPWLELDKHVNISLIVALVWGEVGEALPRAAMCAIGYATSHAHGCSYCQTHTSANGGERSLSLTETLERIWRGEKVDNTPLGEFEIALAQLAADASTNTVPNGQVARARRLAKGAAAVTNDPDKAIEAVEMMVACFGFLNIFNDLTGVQVEGDWYENVHTRLGIEGGKHEPKGPNPNNLDYDIPTTGPTLEDMLVKYDQEVGDASEFCKAEFGLVPNWIAAWPDHYRNAHIYTYAETMNERDHSLLSAELRHLMARVAAIAKKHDYLAAVEAYIAHHVATDKTQVIDRIRYCYAAAIGEEDFGVFSAAERAALQIAMISTRVPLVTPRRFVEAALRAYSKRELLHVLGTCGVIGSVQRFCAVRKPQIEDQVAAFLTEHDLMASMVELRYPAPLQTMSAAAE